MSKTNVDAAPSAVQKKLPTIKIAFSGKSIMKFGFLMPKYALFSIFVIYGAFFRFFHFIYLFIFYTQVMWCNLHVGNVV